MQPDNHSHDEIVRLLKENQALLLANNELLEKQEKREKRRLILKIVWYTILLGIPMIAYYYLYSMFMGTLGAGVTSPTGGAVVTPDTLNQLLELYNVQ